MKIGLDLCAISRMQAWLDSGRRLDRVFTPAEEAYIRSRGRGAAQSMAGIWCAKEAVMKALGTGLTLPMTDIEVKHDDLGAPAIALQGETKKAYPGDWSLSITHEADMAAAVALYIPEGGDQP